MTENLKDSFVKVINDRLSNQLLVAFCMAWAVINFDFFVAVLKIKDFEVFTRIVSESIFSDDLNKRAHSLFIFDFSQSVYNGFVLPAIIAVLYVVFSPFSNLLISNYCWLHDDLIKKSRSYWDERYLITRDEFYSQKKKYDELLVAYNKLLEEKSLQLEPVVAMRESVNRLESDKQDLKFKVSAYEKDEIYSKSMSEFINDDIFMDDSVVDVVRFLYGAGEPSKIEMISREASIKLQSTNVAVKYLCDGGYAELLNEEVVKLLPKGMVAGEFISKGGSA